VFSLTAEPMADGDLSGRQLGEFVLLQQIGAGGYGAVYRCEQPALQRAAVVKVLRLRRRYDDAARERFLREARLASRLDHPYAAHVYSFGAEDDGVLWIAMELVHGVTLGEWLKLRGPMSFPQFVPFFERVAEVVQAAHERGIVHRDLKPSNIMVIEQGGRLFPKLLDFGIAKLNEGPEGHETDEALGESVFHDPLHAVATVRLRGTPQPVQRTRTDPTPDARLTHPGIVIGSVPYMSPEQWGDPGRVGPAADIYSLGCVVYEALTGRAPFTAASTAEYYRQHLHADPPPLGNELSSLDRILQRALAKSPDARHASALELAADLRAALRARPREQLRSSAQQWQDRARPSGLLWGRDMLAEIERWTGPAPSGAISELEWSFLAASRRRARRITWAWRSLAALAVVAVFGVLQVRSVMQADLAEQRLAAQQTRSMQQLAEVKVTEAELERGRAALLHGEPEALAHLTEAYKHDRSPSTAFMLARAMQPRLGEQARFASTYGRMWWAAFSPDGSQIVTTDDRSAQIWDARTFQLRLALPHGCEVYHAVYSADGARLVTSSQDAVRIWDLTRGALVRDLKGKAGSEAPWGYSMAAISPDGSWIAAIDWAGSRVRVWDAASGTLRAELPGHAAEFPQVAFSAGGWLAMTGGDDVRVFDVRTWSRVLTIPGPSVHSLALDARGHLVTGSATGDVSVWAIPSGTKLRQLRQIGERVSAVAYSPDGRLIAAGSRDGAMQVWHADSGTLQSQLNLRRGKILAVEFDPTSTSVLAANTDGTVVVADAAQGVPLAILEGPQNGVTAAHFDARSHRVVGASPDGTARVWDASSPYRRWSSEPMSDDCGIVTSAEPDRRFVAVGCRARATRVWDTARDQLLAELPGVTPVDGGGFTSAFPAVSAAGDRAAIARGNAVEVYELPGGRRLRTIAHGAAVSAVAFASTGNDLVSGAVDGSLLATRDSGAQLVLPRAGGVDAVTVLPDGRIVVADAQRRLRVYDRGGAFLADLETPVRIISLRFDGARLIAVPSYIGSTAPPLLVDLQRDRIIAQLEGHVGRVFSARWVAGQRILTAGADGTVRLWDGATGQLRQIYRGGARSLADATLASDGVVVAGDADGLLWFWDIASGAKLWTLQAHRSAVIAIHVEGDDLVTRDFAGDVSRWRLPEPDEVIDACHHHPHCATGTEALR
jgi:eukaryotic-like serine/threonine-protein kinase